MQRPSVLTASPRIHSLRFGKVGPAGAAFGFFFKTRLAMFPKSTWAGCNLRKSHSRHRDRTADETTRYQGRGVRFCRIRRPAHGRSGSIASVRTHCKRVRSRPATRPSRSRSAPARSEGFDRVPAVQTWYSDCPNQRRCEWLRQQGVRTIRFIVGKGGILPRCMRRSGMFRFPGRSVTMPI